MRGTESGVGRRSRDAGRRSIRDRNLLAALGAWCVLGGTACVSTEVPMTAGAVPIASGPVVVPLAPAGTEHGPATAYYGSVVSQLQDAVRERNPELLRGLLATHDRSDAPAWAREQMACFRAIAFVLDVEQHVAANGRVTLVGSPALGETMDFEFTIPPAPAPVALGCEGDDATRFLVTFDVVDFDCFGSRTERRFADIAMLLDGVNFAEGGKVEMPIRVDALGAEGCYRRIDVSVEWLPGRVTIDREPAPNQLTVAARETFEVYPRGVDGVRANPYTHLSRGLDSDDAAHLDNVYVAARLMTDDYRDDAIARSIESVRLGRPEQAQAAMAALQVLTREDLAVGDRDGWLAWWRQRDRDRGVDEGR